MVAGLKSRLAAEGMDVEQEIVRGALVLSSEQHHLRGGWEFDTAGMIQMLQRSLEHALRDGFEGLWATGDMTWEFGPARDLSKLLEYEMRLEEFIREHPQMGGICQYHTDTLPREAVRGGVTSHEQLFISETLSMLNPQFLRRHAFDHVVSAGTELDMFIDRILAEALIPGMDSVSAL
jgi:hypothetical protein